MPLYEYVCQRCEVTTEFLESASSASKHVCPECNCKKMDKAFSVFGARFKSGSGVVTSSPSSCSGCRAGACSSCTDCKH
jgi:putative FmdB family regulatory protein